jgi:hypothetical protein
MPRALDHLVIAARDLDAAAERYRRLGLQVGPRNRHPWGTENHIVQFDGAFLELVGLGAAFQRPAPDDPVFPFAGFLDDFLKAREGLAMLVLRSHDAEADRLAFANQGFGERPRFDFARKGRREGREVEVAFSLAFAQSDAFSQTGFFVCQQLYPENFWDAAAQVHPNGATGVAELEIAHPRPQAAAGFLQAFLDASPQPADGGLHFALTGTDVALRASAPAGMRARIAARESFWID